MTHIRAIPAVAEDNHEDVLEALKEAVETIRGERGLTELGRAILVQDLVDAGVLSLADDGSIIVEDDVGTPVVLLPMQNVPNAQTLLRTTNVSFPTIVDSLTVSNYTGGAVTITLWLVPSGETLGNQHQILGAVSVAANSTSDFIEVEGQVLDPSTAIHAQASAATSLNIRMSGSERN